MLQAARAADATEGLSGGQGPMLPPKTPPE